MKYKRTFNLKNVTKQQMHIRKIYLILLCISIHRHVAGDSDTIIRVSYRITNNIKINAQNAKIKNHPMLHPVKMCISYVQIKSNINTPNCIHFNHNIV